MLPSKSTRRWIQIQYLFPNLDSVLFKALALKEEWSHGSVAEALARLEGDRVKVTNEGEKALQVARLKWLEPMLGLLQDFEEERQAYLAVAGGADALAIAESLERMGDLRDRLQAVGAGHEEPMA